MIKFFEGNFFPPKMELKTSLKCNSEICGSENLVQYILSLAASLIGGAWRYKGGTVDGFSGRSDPLRTHRNRDAKAEQERQLEIEKENCQLRAQLEAWQHCIILLSSEIDGGFLLASRARLPKLEW